MAKTKKLSVKEKVVTIPPIDLHIAKVTLVGDSPLLVHRFGAKAIKEIEDKQQKKAKKAKEARNPHAEFLDSLYCIPGKKGQYGIPIGGVKKAAVSACRFIDGVKMTMAKGSFHIVATPGNLVPIKGSKPVMDEQIVRIGNFGNKIAVPRYRARFDKWEITFSVKYNPRIISPEQILNLYENAGFSVGLCEYRPEKDGSFGMFRVKRR